MSQLENLDFRDAVVRMATFKKVMKVGRCGRRREVQMLQGVWNEMCCVCVFLFGDVFFVWWM